MRELSYEITCSFSEKVRCVKVLYDVEEIAKLTKVSKVTVYRKFKLNELKPYIVTKQGKSYLDERGFHVITELLNVISSDNVDVNPKDIEYSETLENKELFHETSCNNSVITELKGEIEFLRRLLENHPSKSEIEFLQSQLREKDRQLESKDRLIENMQILVKNSQSKHEDDIPMLEAHFVDLDEKLSRIKEEMDQRKQAYEEEQKNKSLLKKFFWKK